MKKRTMYLLRHKKISLIILFVLLVAGYLLFPKSNTSISVAKVKKGNIVQAVNASGTVDSATTVNLTFLSSGKLAKAGVKVGDRVETGVTIAVLDQRSIRKSLEQTMTDLAKQQNAFDSTNQKYQAGVLEGQQRVTLDTGNKQSYSAVTENTLIYDSVQRILEDNKYDLTKALNSVELQQLTLEQSVLTSPISGIVTRADAQIAGVNVSPTTVFTIADPDHLIFNADVDEADIGKIRGGQTVNLTLDAFPDISMPLSVTNIDFASHKSDTGGTVYKVETTLPVNADYKYRIGMSGDAEIITARKANTLLIPLSSLIDERHVYLQKGKTFSKQIVTTGLQSDTDIEIISGLNEGDTVALVPEEVSKILKK